MIVKRVSRCTICGKEIVTKGTDLNQLAIQPINEIKVDWHMYWEHGFKYLSVWRLWSCFGLVVIGYLLVWLASLVWLVTVPFWGLHELCEALWR